MATRSRIIIKNNDEYKGIYCHFDGDIESVGVTLFKHYNNEEKVKQLIELGNISSIGNDLESCVAYSRDRGENKEDNKAFIKHSFYDCYWHVRGEIEFFYVFDNGQWFVATHKDAKLKPLANFFEIEKSGI